MSICGAWECTHRITAFWGEGSVFSRFSKGSRLQELLKAVVLDRLRVLEAERSWGMKSSYAPLSRAPHLGAVAPGGLVRLKNQTVGARKRGFVSWTVLSWKGP